MDWGSLSSKQMNHIATVVAIEQEHDHRTLAAEH